MATIAFVCLAFVVGMLTGSTLGIRGYKRRQLQTLLQRLQVPHQGPIALVREDEDGLNVLSPLTGKDMAQPGMRH